MVTVERPFVKDHLDEAATKQHTHRQQEAQVINLIASKDQARFACGE